MTDPDVALSQHSSKHRGDTIQSGTASFTIDDFCGQEPNLEFQNASLTNFDKALEALQQSKNSEKRYFNTVFEDDMGYYR